MRNPRTISITPKMTSQKPRKIVRNMRDEAGSTNTTPPATMLRMPVIAFQARPRTSEYPLFRLSQEIA
jgi:hypothetical protein